MIIQVHVHTDIKFNIKNTTSVRLQRNHFFYKSYPRFVQMNSLLIFLFTLNCVCNIKGTIEERYASNHQRMLHAQHIPINNLIKLGGIGRCILLCSDRWMRV